MGGCTHLDSTEEAQGGDAPCEGHDETDPAIFSRAMGFAMSLAMTPVGCIDTPGLALNRLLVPYICSALLLVARLSPLDSPRARSTSRVECSCVS